MSLKLVSLASGSKGNATLILSDETALLVDAGISYTRIKEELKAFGLSPSSLDGVLITHEHTDHISALPKLCEQTEIYAHELTAKAICERQGALKNIREVQYYECGFMVGDINVYPFRIPHDAAYPLAYSFECRGARVSVATDVGRPTVGVFNNICSSEVVLLESNHDADMLKYGSYAPFLKKRISGGNGHLSNDGAALIAERLTGSRVKTLLLGHLSENNNLPELAQSTVRSRLDMRKNTEIDVYVAYQNRRSEVFEIK